MCKNVYSKPTLKDRHDYAVVEFFERLEGNNSFTHYFTESVTIKVAHAMKKSFHRRLAH